MQLYRLLEDKFSSKKDVKYGSKGDLVYCINKSEHVLIVEKVKKQNNEYVPTGEKFSIKESLLQKV